MEHDEFDVPYVVRCRLQELDRELFTVIIEPESGLIYGVTARLGSLMDIAQSYYATVEVDLYPIVKVFRLLR